MRSNWGSRLLEDRNKQSLESETLLKEHRAELRKRELSQSEGNDRTILTIALAVIGINLTSLKGVAAPGPLEKGLFFCGCGVLLISVIAIVLSFHSAIKAMERSEEISVKLYVHKQLDALEELNGWDRCTNILNYAIKITFIVGIMVSLLFLYLIFTKEVDMSDSNKSKSTEQRGAMAPKLTPPQLPKVNGGVQSPKLVPVSKGPNPPTDNKSQK